MKLILTAIFICFYLSTLNLAQDGSQAKVAENGYTWLSLSQPTNKLTDHKHNYLASILDNQKLRKLSGKKTPLLFNCDNDLTKLTESDKSDQVSLDIVVKMIDNFYSNKENLVIPVLGAYCYCIKELSGMDSKELEKYRQELLNYSKE